MPIPKEIRLPFSPYDTFGYLIPGFFFFLSLLTFEYLGINSLTGEQFATGKDPHCPPLLQLVFPLAKASHSWETQLLILAGTLTIFYIAGHVIAAISSLVIERVLIQKVHEYPFISLLGPKDKLPEFTVKNISLTTATYLFAFQFFNVSLILFAIGAITSTNWVLLSSCIMFTVTAFLCLVSYGYYHFVLRNISDNWEQRLGKLMRLLRCFFAFAIIPYRLIIYPLSLLIQSKQGFDSHFQELFEKHYQKEFLDKELPLNTNAYWFSYMYVIEQTATLGTLITNWLHLYSFARNLSTACYLSFLCMVLYVWYYQCKDQMVMLSSGAVLVMGLVFILSFIMAIRYYYLYYNYYSKFIFRAFIYACRHQKTDTKPGPASAGQH